jgi:hypothetical protein
MGKTVRQRKALEAGGSGGSGGCVFIERSDLCFIPVTSQNFPNFGMIIFF